MGIDFLDMVFQIEKKHGVSLKPIFRDNPAAAELRNLGQMVPGRRFFGRRLMRWDIRTGRFFAFLRPHLVPWCQKCKASLPWMVGPAGAGRCPGCGRDFQWSEVTWDSFREILSSMLGKKVGDIHEDSWLVSDLNFDEFGFKTASPAQPPGLNSSGP